MSTDADGYGDDLSRSDVAVDRIRELPLGAATVLVGGCVLFFSLFLTWQSLEVDYGPAGTGTQLLDGWDALGLLVGLLTLALVALVVVVRLSDVEVSPSVRWDLVTLVVASAVLGLLVLKNLTDRDSTWASYLAVAVAGAVVAGAYLDWSRGTGGRRSLAGRRRRRVSRAA
jgi:hypothetical protein